MLEINLIPSSLRKKRKGRLWLQGFNIPLEVIIGLGGGLVILLILVHIGLLFVNMRQIALHKKLQQEGQSLAPGRANVERAVNELRSLQGKQKAAENVVSGEKISWSQKLNILSDNLPRGVWLKRIRLEAEGLSIEGSAISEGGEEMINVHRFTAGLKGQKEFLEHFTDLELGSIQRRKIKHIEVADFVITARLK